MVFYLRSLLSVGFILGFILKMAAAFTLARSLSRSKGTSITSRGNIALKATDKTTIAIVGSGAVGGYYGARLWETGVYDVKFHMRGDHYETSKSDGLNVTSVHGDIFIPPKDLQAYTETADIGKVDWVVVGLKSSALDAIPELVYPLLEPGKTRILAIMNGLIEDDLIRQLKQFAGEEHSGDDSLQCCAALYGGMALVCSNRLGPGRIDHSYAGLLSGGVAALSPDVTPEQNQAAFEALWEPAKVDIAYEPSLLRGRWRKVRFPPTLGAGMRVLVFDAHLLCF
jgi:2-dehydropantoate 2-reductase